MPKSHSNGGNNDGCLFAFLNELIDADGIRCLARQFATDAQAFHMGTVDHFQGNGIRRSLAIANLNLVCQHHFERRYRIVGTHKGVNVAFGERTFEDALVGGGGPSVEGDLEQE